MGNLRGLSYFRCEPSPADASLLGAVGVRERKMREGGRSPAPDSRVELLEGKLLREVDYLELD